MHHPFFLPDTIIKQYTNKDNSGKATVIIIYSVISFTLKTIEGNRITIAQYTIPIGKMYKNNVIQWLGDS